MKTFQDGQKITNIVGPAPAEIYYHVGLPLNQGDYKQVKSITVSMELGMGSLCPRAIVTMVDGHEKKVNLLLMEEVEMEEVTYAGKDAEVDRAFDKAEASDANQD